MIILNRIGALMLLSLFILLVVMVLSGVPVSSMTPLAGTVLFVEDVGYRISRYNPQNDKFLTAIHWSGGGSFFFLPAWLCAAVGLIYSVFHWHILIIYGVVLCLTDIAVRLRRAQVDRTARLKAIIDWKLGSILVVIPLWVAGLVLILVVGSVYRNANKKTAPPTTRAESATPTVTPRRDPPAGMVLVPGATFEFRNGEKKQTAQVSSFYIDQYEVSVEDFNKFLASSSYRSSATQEGEAAMFKDVNSQGPNYPVGFVSMKDAKAFCASSAKRLPTPQEWQLAALGVDGRLWPWGSWSVNTANIHTSGASKIGSYPKDKSPSGAFDMGGNMLEWTTEGSMGGSYATDFQNPTMLIKDNDDWVGNSGFRCAADAK